MAEYDTYSLLVIQMATNIVKVMFNEVVDLNTMPNELTVLGIHAPCTALPYIKLRGLFYNYRKYKYLGCSVSVAPAATLPMDPAGIGYEAGLPTVDPRDVLNPILFHGTHGMSLGVAMDTAFRSTGLSSGSSSISRFDVPDSNSNPWWGANNYYDALSDPSWRKYSVMAPFRISNLHPMVHRVVTTTNVPVPRYGADNVMSLPDPEIYTIGGHQTYETNLFGLQSMTVGPEDPQLIVQQIFTNGVERLGWLDTYTREPLGENSVGTTDTPVLQHCPKAFMGVLVFPPAYSVKLCFRLSIKHYFVFKDFVTADTRTGITTADGYFDKLDDSVIPANVEQMNLNVPSSLEISNGDVELVTSSVS